MKNLKRKVSEEELLLEHEEAEKNRHAPSRPLSKEETDALLLKVGLQSINLRLPIEVINKLKIAAEGDGLKYQPYIRRLLVQHVNSQDNLKRKDELRAEIREIVREELAKTG